MARSSGFKGLLIAVLSVLTVALSAPTGRAEAVQAARQGDVVSLVDYAAPNSIGASKSQLLTYWMQGFSGGMVQATAAVFTPMGTPPTGGWPVVVWIHGTTTVGGDQCAPTVTMDTTRTSDPDAGYYPYLMTLGLLVQSGHVVVAPDLEGLGTPDVYPYYNRASNANAAIGAVMAAHSALPSTSPTWAVVGHSEGGHGAIATAEMAANAGLDFRGTVALAPFENIVMQFNMNEAFAQAATRANDTATLTAVRASQNAVVAVVAAGVKAENPAFDYGEIMGPDLAAEMSTYLNECITPAATATFLAITAKGPAAYQGFKPGWYNQTDVARFLARNDLGQRPDIAITTPLLVLQGNADVVVREQPVAAVVSQLVATGTPVSFHTYPGAGHDTVIAAGAGDMLTFLRRILR